jgi:hypothetical protein
MLRLALQVTLQAHGSIPMQCCLASLSVAPEATRAATFQPPDSAQQGRATCSVHHAPRRQTCAEGLKAEPLQQPDSGIQLVGSCEAATSYPLGARTRWRRLSVGLISIMRTLVS